MSSRQNWLIGVAAAVGTGLAASALLRRSEWEWDGKVVLITGGSRGLGLALARSFAARGCRIAICARHAGELRTAREDLEQQGAEVMTLQCDVGDREAVERMTGAALSHYGQIDVLVNNAGEIQAGPVETMAVEDFEDAMRVMFWGTVYPTLALLPHLEEGSRIVNITSIGGHLLPYSCAKFAAVGFSDGLRAELAPKGVKVVTIAAGLMRTGAHGNAKFKGDPEQIVEATARGDSEAASLADRVHGLFPGITADLLGMVASLLAKGSGRQGKRGHQTGMPPWLAAATMLGRAAARHFLQPEKA